MLLYFLLYHTPPLYTPRMTNKVGVATEGTEPTSTWDWAPMSCNSKRETKRNARRAGMGTPFGEWESLQATSPWGMGQKQQWGSAASRRGSNAPPPQPQ